MPGAPPLCYRFPNSFAPSGVVRGEKDGPLLRGYETPGYSHAIPFGIVLDAPFRGLKVSSPEISAGRRTFGAFPGVGLDSGSRAKALSGMTQTILTMTVGIGDPKRGQATPTTGYSEPQMSLMTLMTQIK